METEKMSTLAYMGIGLAVFFFGIITYLWWVGDV